MSDIKSVLGLLAKVINLCTEIHLTAEHFQLAQRNEATADLVIIIRFFLFFLFYKNNYGLLGWQYFK